MRQMKYSGIEWIGEIPDDWELLRIGLIFRCRNEKVNDTDYPPLSVTRNGIVPQMESVAKTDANDNRKLVKVNDFVINSRSDRKQSCGVSDLEGSVSLINTVLFTENDDIILPAYTNLIMKNYGFAEEFYRWGHGIVADLWTTRWQEMKSIVLPLPSVFQQKKIIGEVYKKCAEIDCLIAHEETMIDELKAYKQSVITEAVTKGLDRTAPMKNSGVEWIGEIPEHWLIMPLKSKFNFGKGLSITKADLVSEGIKVISYGQIHAKYNKSHCINKSLYRFVDSQYLQICPSALVRRGDFIFADTSEDIEGSGDFVYIDNSDLIFAGYHCITLKNKNLHDGKYLAFLFMSQNWKNQIQSQVNGVKLFSITKRYLADAKLLLPPQNEQQQIADYLDKKCAEIDQLISLKQEKIEELRDYKKSLIYEYVTGKKEVV